MVDTACKKMATECVIAQSLNDCIVKLQVRCCPAAKEDDNSNKENDKENSAAVTNSDATMFDRILGTGKKNTQNNQTVALAGPSRPSTTCQWTGMLMNLNKHRCGCSFRLVACPLCYQKMSHRELGALPLTERMTGVGHLGTACPKALVPCPFGAHGCHATVCRENVEAHCSDHGVHHTQLLVKALDRERKFHTISIYWDISKEDCVPTLKHRKSLQSSKIKTPSFEIFQEATAGHCDQIYIALCVLPPDDTFAAASTEALSVSWEGVKSCSNQVQDMVTFVSKNAFKGVSVSLGTEHDPFLLAMLDRSFGGLEKIKVSAAFKVRKPDAFHVHSVGHSTSSVHLS